MSTFRCGKCGCNEDTALCHYWSARVRDISPVCSACDTKIAKWHGQFPRLFGTFLVTPTWTSSPRDVFASMVGRLSLAESGQDDRMHAQKSIKVAVPAGPTFDFDDPIPSYKPLTARV
jgi:hypothetical protein